MSLTGGLGAAGWDWNQSVMCRGQAPLSPFLETGPSLVTAMLSHSESHRLLRDGVAHGSNFLAIKYQEAFDVRTFFFFLKI